jgi:Zn-dependent peptidase ImmA (M78 family)
LLDIIYEYNIIYETFNFDVDKFSGMLHTFNNRYVIVTNHNHHQRKKIFTLAHELGHYFLHLHIMNRFVCNELFNILNKKIEWEANRFAAELLMPINVYMPMVRTYKANFRRIANELHLSEEAVRWRYVFLCNEYHGVPLQKLIHIIINPYKELQKRTFSSYQPRDILRNSY